MSKSLSPIANEESTGVIKCFKSCVCVTWCALCCYRIMITSIWWWRHSVCVLNHGDLTHNARTCHFISSSVNREIKSARVWRERKKPDANNVCVLVRLRSITSAYLSLLGNCVCQLFGELEGAHTTVKWCDVNEWPISNCCCVNQLETPLNGRSNTRPKNLW